MDKVTRLPEARVTGEEVLLKINELIDKVNYLIACQEDPSLIPPIAVEPEVTFDPNA